MSQIPLKRVVQQIAITATMIAVAALLLRVQGRRWLCTCGRLSLWVSDAWSVDTSQHLLDPYSFTHLLHGFLFCWSLMLIFPRLPTTRQLSLAIMVEVGWEVIENTSFVIGRYREATAALGYAGDTIINSLGDILMCGVGFVVARRLGFYRSLMMFAAVEVMLLFWIRDSLLLNVLMLVYPAEGIKAWQAGH